MSPKIRRYADGDRAAVYDICVETAGAGQGVRGRYSTDDLVPDTVAGPYLFLEPRHAYVLDDGGRAVGYVIGTPDTAGYVAGYQQRWLPRLRGKYQPLSGPPVTDEDQRIDAMFHPERWVLPELADHPAHLHVNVLAGYRGSGHGRTLLDTFLASVAEAGAKSCYLAVRQANVNAQRFYAKLGWQPIDIPGAEPGTFLTHPTR
ncbi:MAG TPA: GNAT family N-acetyltransferase [Pseudonocardiaceae bacterium]|nr:GNAT family N-acetyltransferase [Pseudonocardiaceae bacterium]